MGRIPKVPQSRTCGQRRIQRLWLGGGCRGSGDGRPPAGSKGRAPGGILGMGSRGGAPRSFTYFDYLTFDLMFIFARTYMFYNG